MKNKVIGTLIIVIVAAVAGWYVITKNPAGSASAHTIVATVNGATVMQDELAAAEASFAARKGLSATSTTAQAQFQTQALNSIIEQELLKQAATKAGFTASSTEVAAKLASIKSQFSSASAFQQALAQQAMTESLLRTQIQNNLLISAFLAQKLRFASTTATNAEIQALYNKLAAQNTGTSTPPLSAVRSQMTQLVIQQKEQAAISAYAAQLRAGAAVKILIASSTPAA